MSAGLEYIRQAMADYLNGQGVCAITAWPMEPRAERDQPVIVVSLRGCQAGRAGFQDYLGEWYDEKTGLWNERYGRKAKLTFGLDVYAPEKGDGEAVQRAFDQLAGALILGGPEGLQVEEFSCGQTVFDQDLRRLKRPAEAVCAAYLCATVQPGGTFTDFELRGVVKQ